jgi:hypothetical protein
MEPEHEMEAGVREHMRNHTWSTGHAHEVREKGIQSFHFLIVVVYQNDLYQL